MDTRDLEDLLEEEEEFYEAAEEIEHNLGINQSMVDWFDVSFQSSFVNTAEFANRAAPVIQPLNCEDCKEYSKLFEKQRDLLMKQDKQVQESHRNQKMITEESKKIKANLNNTENQLKETTDS